MPIITPSTTDTTVRQRSGSVATASSAGNPPAVGMKWARADYSFAAQGGAIGTLDLLGSNVIPLGAIILGGLVDISVAPTGASATIAITVEGANDIVTAAAVSGAPWSTTGRKSVIPVFTGATSVKTTAARTISAVIASGALTAGTFSVYLAYIETV
jgi:hypothetical protein